MSADRRDGGAPASVSASASASASASVLPRGPATRDVILDATEAIMRDLGYAAVSSRRVAERAGLRSQLVHYHFGTMDDLFLAVAQRAEAAYVAAQAEALASVSPAQALWRLSRQGDDIALTLELVAAANHRKQLRHELARSLQRVREMQVSALARALPDTQVADHDPHVVTFLIAAITRALSSEANIGATDGHAQIIAFMERLLAAGHGPRAAA